MRTEIVSLLEATIQLDSGCNAHLLLGHYVHVNLARLVEHLPGGACGRGDAGSRTDYRVQPGEGGENMD